MASVRVNQRVDERVADDQNQKQVEMAEEAGAIRTFGTGEDEDEMEEERTPADDEDAEQDGQSDGSLHAGGLAAALVEHDNAPGVDVRKNEHVQIKDSGKHQSNAEKSHKTYDNGVVRVVDNEKGAGDGTGQPNYGNDGHCTLGRHDAVVAQCVKNGDVAIGGDGAKE